MNTALQITFAILAFFQINYSSNNLSGTLNNSGNPIKDVDVALKKVPGGEILNQIKTNNEGGFNLDGIQTGNYQLFFNKISLSKKGNITGQIKLNNNGKCCYKTILKNKAGESLQESETDENGNYRFKDVDAGMYQVIVNIKI
jgi:5-hydroxyisourate hydrolase-like protein (transthyretin family)